MTTAHKPTYHPAVGSATQGGYRYHAPRAQFSVKDVAAHTVLKVRQPGQGAPEDIAVRDLKAELQQREREHKDKQDDEKKKKGLLPYAEKSVDPSKLLQSAELKKFDDSDESGGEDSEDEDSDDEEAELQKELARLRKEKEDDKKRKEEKEKEDDAAKLNAEVLKGNPLLIGESNSLKRRWDDDVVFKNQARDLKKVQKRFINDTIRGDFHRNFMKKYIQ